VHAAWYKVQKLHKKGEGVVFFEVGNLGLQTKNKAYGTRDQEQFVRKT
jgi:hypothetical protein